MATLSNDQIKTIFAKAHKAQSLGQLDQAAANYQRLLKGGANLAEVHFNLAKISAARGQTREAGTSFEAALKLRPTEPAIWEAYLSFASQLPNTAPFAKILARAEAAGVALPQLSYFRALNARNEARYTDAAELFEAQIKSGPAIAQTHIDYSALLELLGQDTAALAQLDAALALSPNSERAISRKADLLRNLGRKEEALDFTRAALDKLPQLDVLYYTYASITKLDADDPMIEVMQKRLAKLSKSNPAATYLNMALAKAMEDTGETTPMWRHLHAANAAKARRHPYDAATDKAQMQDLRGRYDALEKTPAPEATDIAPIFISGLPRSGTTLIEQIIASHSEVTGGGEIGVLSAPLLAAAMEPATTPQTLAQIGQDYAAKLAQILPQTPRFTDKSINTHLALGFAQMALPHARFIVVRRDPRDNALSIYKNNFADGQHRYSNAMRDIARFMRLSEDQLDYWKQACPGVIAEIRYEDLIADPETQARAAVKAAGLDWQEACLSFYDTARKVKTLSSAQVRQPIYSSSVGAWKAHAEELKPFLDEYGEVDPAYSASDAP